MLAQDRADDGIEEEGAAAEDVPPLAGPGERDDTQVRDMDDASSSEEESSYEEEEASSSSSAEDDWEVEVPPPPRPSSQPTRAWRSCPSPPHQASPPLHRPNPQTSSSGTMILARTAARRRTKRPMRTWSLRSLESGCPPIKSQPHM